MSKEITDSGVTELSPEGYETIIQHIHDAVYTLDPNGHITWVNEVAVEEYDTGYTRDDLIGAPVSKLLSGDDITKCVEIITDLVKSDERDSGRCEIAIQTADGREIECDLHLALLPFDDGEFQGTIGVLRDITQRKRREQGRMVLNRVLRHNVRNRVTVIMGQAESLRKQITAADPKASIKSIVEAAEELVRLSDKARRVDEALAAEEQPFEPHDIVSIVKARCQEFQAQYDHVDLSIEATGAVWVRCDDRIEYLIDNLIENAIEHTDREAPTVTVSVTDASDTNRLVEIQVADDGPGIPRDEIDSLMRGEETSLRHGSGLGLWLVKWLTDVYGGDLEFSDRAPRGSIVTVRLHPDAPN